MLFSRLDCGYTQFKLVSTFLTLDLIITKIHDCVHLNEYQRTLHSEHEVNSGAEFFNLSG